MASAKNEGLCPLTEQDLDLLGDFNFPVIPDATFARTAPDSLPSALKGKETVFEKANIVCDGNSGVLMSTTIGMVVISEKGMRVEPLWTVSDGGMRMTMTFYPQDCFGNPISDDKYREKGLPEGSRGVDNDALDEAVARSLEGGTVVKDVDIAKGMEAVQGRPGEVRLGFQHEGGVGAKKEDGSIDFRERGGTTSVQEGEEIARLIPPGKGHAGFDVLGNELPASNGTPAVLKAGKDVKATEEEGGILVYTAGVTGMVIYRDNTLSISDLLEINSDVDLSSGNVHVEKGSILIKGTVTTGAEVSAEENVVVEVVVENATIRAGGDVTVGGGILMEEGGVIKAGGNVTAKFMRNATIRAGGDVIAEVDFVNCDIVAGGRIIAESDKGHLNGGTYVCGGMNVAEMGSDVGARTAVTLALPDSGSGELDAKTLKIKEKINELEKYIGSDDIKNTLLLAPKEDRGILAELFRIKGTLLRQKAALDEQKAAALLARGKDLARRRLKARRTAHPGVTINIGDRSITLNKAEQASKFHWDADKGGIAITGI
jgi:hypothetical protein